MRGGCTCASFINGRASIHGYSAHTADKEAHIIEKFDVNDVVMNRKRLTRHNFVFR